MNLFFDATIGETWVENLRGFFRTHKEPRPRLLHIYERFPRDIKDPKWIPQIATLDYVIITADSGRSGKKNTRLPALCKRYKITHIIFSPTMHTKATLFEKARAIIVLWPQMERTLNHPLGSRFQIQAVDSAREHFRLMKKN